ncbi:MAG: hypothetical protein KBC78_04480 [Candidatus Pacebacteria bacterium]|nr:hypothetical protein [Candidatus Paceibacterota bacterium]
MRILGIVVCIVAAIFFVAAGSVATTAENQSLDNQELTQKFVDLAKHTDQNGVRIYIDTANRSDEQFAIWRNTFYGLAVGFTAVAIVFAISQFMLIDEQDRLRRQAIKQAEEVATTPEPTT